MTSLLRYRGHVNFAYTDSSANGAVPANARTVALSATTDCYLAFGTTDAVAATSAGILLPAGTILYVELPAGTTHIAALRVATNGRLSVMAAY